uniref:Uncharacterized protein n=1 Tax=Anguilla anguilla TaxID=7936 RepID=A0A0E9QYV5_ANGAN
MHNCKVNFNVIINETVLCWKKYFVCSLLKSFWPEACILLEICA